MPVVLMRSAAIPLRDEHHAIFDGSAYADAREQHRDLFPESYHHCWRLPEPASMQ